MLFAVPVYAGRPLDRHIGLPLGSAHFSRWVSLWSEEVERHFSGERAECAKRAAIKMSLRMGLARDDLRAEHRFTDYLALPLTLTNGQSSVRSRIIGWNRHYSTRLCHALSLAPKAA